MSEEVLTAEEQAALEKFKAFCIAEQQESDVNRKLDQDENQDWMSLSLGFFKALGIENTRCWTLALKARYAFEYWSSDV